MANATIEIKSPTSISSAAKLASNEETSPNDEPISLRSAEQTSGAGSGPNSDASGSDALGDSPQDERDMLRMGKKQEFKRNFGFWSTLAFVSVYMGTWEFVLTSLSANFSSGGFAGLFWSFLTTVVYYATIVASLAEMASMAPTAGGQYHWVSEFAPPRFQKVLSYASGWMSTLGWLASVASSNFVVVTQIQAMINVSRPEYEFARWEFTAIVIGFAFITVFFNTWGVKVLPKLGIMSLVGHVLGFFVVMIALWATCERNNARDVFVDFQDKTGYDNVGIAYLISQVYVMYCSLGSDSVVHLSEEVENASLIVPKCMWWSYLGNVLFGIAMLLTMLFCIGPLDAVLAAKIPFHLLFTRTGSPALSLALNVIVFILIFAGNVAALATCAREMFAFARDKGLPLSHLIGQMNTKWSTPFNSVYAASLVVILLSLINLGSWLAFSTIVSLSLLGLMSTYMISIGCVLLKRFKGEALPPARWSLGRYGPAINTFAILYSALVIIMSCFPTSRPENFGSANWAPLVWVAVGAISVVWYLVHGGKQYTAPVEFVEGKKAGGVGLQSS